MIKSDLLHDTTQLAEWIKKTFHNAKTVPKLVNPIRYPAVAIGDYGEDSNNVPWADYEFVTIDDFNPTGEYNEE